MTRLLTIGILGTSGSGAGTRLPDFTTPKKITKMVANKEGSKKFQL